MGDPAGKGTPVTQWDKQDEQHIVLPIRRSWRRRIQYTHLISEQSIYNFIKEHFSNFFVSHLMYPNLHIQKHSSWRVHPINGENNME